MRHHKLTETKGVQYYCTILGIRNSNLKWNGVFKASIQIFWELKVGIFIDQFLSWNFEKNTWSYEHLNDYLCRMTNGYLGKIHVFFLELSFLKCNENATVLFQNNHNKEKGLFFLLVALFFLKYKVHNKQ